MNKGYGKDEKVIMFSDSDKRHAELILKLRRDGLSSPQFFRSIITGYIQNDPSIVMYVTSVKEKLSRLGKQKIKDTANSIETGNKMLKDLGLSEGDIDFVFDLIAGEEGDT
jgi:hypothetical protein